MTMLTKPDWKFWGRLALDMKYNHQVGRLTCPKLMRPIETPTACYQKIDKIGRHTIFLGESDIVWWSLWRWWIVRWESQTETCKDETGPQISPHIANFAQTDSPTPRRQETRPKQLSTLMFAAKCKCCKDNDQNDRQSKKASKQPFAGLCLCVTVKAATPNCNSNLQLAHVLVKTEDACDLTCDHARWCDDDDRLWLCIQLHYGCNSILQPCDSTLQITCAGTAHKLLL